MPIVYQNPTYPYQVSFGGVKAPSTQLNYRQMLSEVTQWNPDLDPMVAGRFVNNYYRKVIDRRSWYGLKLRGFAYVQQPVTQGQVTVTAGNSIVTGIGTNWPTIPANQIGTIIGMQFRTSFTNAYQTIANVISGTSLQLETPYAAQSQTQTGYQIVAAYLNFGANIKRLLWALNQQMGWPMDVNVPVETINMRDTWRTNLGWSKVLANRSMDPSGALLVECWPTPFSNQTFPFEGYQQPPDLVLDSDAPVAWIPADLIVKRASADAMVHPSNKRQVNMVLYSSFIAEYDKRLEEAEQSDNNLDQRDVTWDYGEEDGSMGTGTGSMWAFNHDV